ncbi:MAG TPA: site-2 protease family protein [Sphingomonadaceae bacterium]|nr:site-2 protease family protein [Sphingomonadaceae bacterium]
MNETILSIIALVPALVVAIVFHEVAHGYVAKLLGDPTASERGRLSLNPIRHVDPVGTLLVPGALALLGGPIFGWAKPVPVNGRRLNNPRRDMMLVGAAGPASNLLLAGIGAILLGLLFGYAGLSTEQFQSSLTVMMLQYFLLINVFLAMFNLLPIPPFDGSHIVEGLLPRSAAEGYAKFRQYGMFLFILLIAITWAFPNSGVIENVVWPPVEWMLNHYYRLADWVAAR